MKLLVGLGNPGEQYARTRHNLGRDLLLEIVNHYGLPMGTKRFQGLFGDGRIAEERIYWLLPETYMNLSGESVGAALRYFRMEPEQVIVFHDDVDLAFGKIRIKSGGGNGGHNGLKSIQQILGSANFIRVRLGVGRPRPGVDTAHHVLGGFHPDEQIERNHLLTTFPPVLPLILKNDFAAALTRLALARNQEPTP